MNDVGSAQETAVKHAADELASRLKGLADFLGSRTVPRRLPYGPGRLGYYFRRHSPDGFPIDRSGSTVLLPDGRIWSYSRSESSRFPHGRVFDASVDYPEFAGSRSFPGGREFIFLGAVLNKYSFGWAAPDATDGDEPGGLRAIYGEGTVIRWVTADEAFEAITEYALASQD